MIAVADAADRSRAAAVSLTVSSGPPRVAVPNVVGLTQSAATAITGANLALDDDCIEHNGAGGSVLSQSPTA